ncbi:hypothetical protein A9Q99_08530 [Gammaproteobacteria bacterium 45_16_T64]|nr:hypothetical protein A9Q99_08530 [Gammaproteobacteria bacterium 45_16_T64]
MSSKVNPAHAQNLLKVLEKDRNLSTHLVLLLKEERESLELRQFKSYSQILARKQRTLVDLESTDCQRREIMVGMGFSGDNDGFLAFLKLIPHQWQKKFSALWEQLTESLQQCENLNKINGKILLHSQIAIDRLMGLMKGQTQQACLYTKSGRAGPTEAQRMLATA